MDYILLIGAVFLIASISVLAGFYNRKTEEKKDASALYSLVFIIGVLFFWFFMLLSDGFEADVKVIPYSVLFSAGYTTCIVSLVYALRCGPVGLTSLFLQLSIVSATVWGFFFWDTELTYLVIIGLLMVVVSIWLCLYEGKKEEKKINLKWILFVSLAFTGNAVGTITQKTQQLKFDGKYGSFFMFTAMIFALCYCVFAYLRSDRRDTVKILKYASPFPIVAGIFNGLSNLFIIILATSPLSPSLVYSVIGVGGLMVTTVFSTLVFKEKMNLQKWLGLIIGTVAIGILSI